MKIAKTNISSVATLSLSLDLCTGTQCLPNTNPVVFGLNICGPTCRSSTATASSSICDFPDVTRTSHRTRGPYLRTFHPERMHLACSRLVHQAPETRVWFGDMRGQPLYNIPDTPWDCHICRSVGVVPEGSMGRQSYGSPMGRVWVYN